MHIQYSRYRDTSLLDMNIHMWGMVQEHFPADIVAKQQLKSNYDI